MISFKLLLTWYLVLTYLAEAILGGNHTLSDVTKSYLKDVEKAFCTQKGILSNSHAIIMLYHS